MMLAILVQATISTPATTPAARFEEIIAHADATQAHLAFYIFLLTGALVLVTFWYALSTWKMARATEKLAREGAAQGKATVRLARSTDRLAHAGSTQAQAMQQMAQAAIAQLGEAVQHRNLLERQIHAPSIEILRKACVRLWDVCRVGGIVYAEYFRALTEWEAVVSERALSLPQDAFDAIRQAWQLGTDLLSMPPGASLTLGDRQLLACELSLYMQNVLAHYMRVPGAEIERHPLPDVGSDYGAWLRQRDAAERDPSHDGSPNKSPDA